MQPPDGRQRNDQDNNISADIDHARANQDGILIHTFLALRYQRVFADAFEGDAKDQRNSVE